MATAAEARGVLRSGGRRRLVASPGAWLAWGAVAFFGLHVAGVLGSVAVNSFATSWFDSWLPQGYTTRWYRAAWDEFALGSVLVVTLEVALSVVLGAVALGVPAAYALARRDFPAKRAVTLLFLLPIMLPPITYGIPLATLLYSVGLAGTLTGVIVANLVPAVPFVILVMTPFIEQIDPNIESAARMSGARTHQLFARVLVPLLLPGILAAAILILVRTLAMFELTFLTAGSDSQTLVVALYYSVFAAGIRAGQSVDAMAVIYMLTALPLLVIALRFVNPTQLVAEVREQPAE
jgi:putative spermidine/putrescine transport system permease protein